MSANDFYIAALIPHVLAMLPDGCIVGRAEMRQLAIALGMSMTQTPVEMKTCEQVLERPK